MSLFKSKEIAAVIWCFGGNHKTESGRKVALQTATQQHRRWGEGGIARAQAELSRGASERAVRWGPRQPPAQR